MSPVIQKSLLRNFQASDVAVAAEMGTRTTAQEVASVRQSLLQSWRNQDTADFDLAVKNWLVEAIKVDPAAEAQPLRSMGRSLFGRDIPANYLADCGFQVWEVKGNSGMQRSKVRPRYARAMTIQESMASTTWSYFCSWVCDAANDKASPLAQNVVKILRGNPLESTALILLALGHRETITTPKINLIYRKATGASLGPYYLEAALWAQADYAQRPATQAATPATNAPATNAPAPVSNVSQATTDYGSVIADAVNRLVTNDDSGLAALIALLRQDASKIQTRNKAVSLRAQAAALLAEASALEQGV